MSKPSPAEAPIYQCKISLKGIIPPIWRKFQVRSDITLYRLHLVLQSVMGWQNYHLYEFAIEGVLYSEPSDEEWYKAKNARQVKLNRVIEGAGSKFIYLYDFGDDWQHALKVEKVLPPNPDIRYAVCLAGGRACPPEDCGGTWGYMNMLEALKDPKHEEHASFLVWLGGGFDPEAFELDRVNTELRWMR
jgi:hypothetical protein